LINLSSLEANAINRRLWVGFFGIQKMGFHSIQERPF